MKYKIFLLCVGFTGFGSLIAMDSHREDDDSSMSKKTAGTDCSLKSLFRLSLESLIIHSSQKEISKLIVPEDVSAAIKAELIIRLETFLKQYPPMVTVLKNDRFVYSLAFSPDGQFVVTGSGGRTAQIWNRATGQTIKKFKGHTRSIRSVAFSPNGEFVVTGSKDMTARIWDRATGQTIKELKGHTGWVNSVAFSPDSQFVITGSQDKTARIWDRATGETIKELKAHTSYVSSVAFSPDTQFVVTGSWDDTARIWDRATGETIKELKGHTGTIFSVAFSSDAQFVVTRTSDETARIWEINPENRLTWQQLLLILRLYYDPKLLQHDEGWLRIFNNIEPKTREAIKLYCKI